MINEVFSSTLLLAKFTFSYDILHAMPRRNRTPSSASYLASRKNQEVSSKNLPEQPVSFRSFRFWILFFFHLLLLTVPLFFTWVNEELFEFNKIILIYGYTAIIGSLWIGRMIVQKKVLFKRTIFDLPILLFFISQLLSTIFSINFHTSLFGYYTRFNGGLLSTMSYIILFYAFVNNVQKKDLSRIFFSTFLASFIVSLLAIPEHFGHSFSCLLIDLSRGNSFSLSLYNTSCWIQDVQTRVFATFGQPNWLAAYDITLIPLGILLASQSLKNDAEFHVSTWQKWFYAIATIALFITLIFTKSRSGVLGLIVGIGFAGAFLGIKWLFNQKNNPLSSTKIVAAIRQFFSIPVLVIALLFGCSIVFFGTPFTPAIPDLLTQHSAPAASPTTPAAPAPIVNRLDEGGTDSGEIRRIVWTGAIKVWERYPILGSGVETFAYSYYKDRPMAHNLVSEWDFLYNKAHNEFLNFLATTGIIGLLTYLLFLASATLLPALPISALQFFYLKRISDMDIENLISSQTQRASLIGLSLTSGIVGLSVSNFFGFSTVMVSTLLFLFPAIWLVFLLPNVDHSKDINSEQISTTQIVSLCLLFFISLATVYQVYNLWNSDHVFAAGKQNSEANQVNVGLPLLEQAIQMAPYEPYFYEELGVTDARIAAALSESKNATQAGEFTQRAIDVSKVMIEMNPVNLNFYKSQARIYSLLAQVDPQYITQALASLEKAHELAPTDPKIMYNIAQIELNVNQRAQGLHDLATTIQMKPNYIQAHLSMASENLKDNELDQAKIQYQYILKNIQSDDQTSIDGLKFIATSSAKAVNKK